MCDTTTAHPYNTTKQMLLYSSISPSAFHVRLNALRAATIITDIPYKHTKPKAEQNKKHTRATEWLPIFSRRNMQIALQAFLMHRILRGLSISSYPKTTAEEELLSSLLQMVYMYLTYQPIETTTMGIPTGNIYKFVWKLFLSISFGFCVSEHNDKKFKCTLSARRYDGTCGDVVTWAWRMACISYYNVYLQSVIGYYYHWHGSMNMINTHT